MAITPKKAATPAPTSPFELLDRVEQAGAARRQLRPKVQLHRSTTTASRSGRRAPVGGEKHTVDQVMFFEQYSADHPAVRAGQRTADDLMVLLLKGEINAAGICRRDLYSFIGNGPGMLFENKNQAYNLEYGLRERAMISTECIQRWLSIIGKELVVTFQPVTEDTQSPT